MNRLKLKHKILILIGAFVAALAVWFFLAQRRADTHEEIYSSSLGASEIPVVWAYVFDYKMNCMHGHIGEAGPDTAFDTLTLLPSDRRLRLRVEESGVYVLSARYEIRSGDRSELIEQTEVTELAREPDGIVMTLPIQNLLIREREYRMDITLTTEEKGDIHYYTRIMLTDETELAQEMLKLATEFSERNFDYESARENTTYVETDGTADDTTLAYVNLKSTFEKLAYGGLKLVPSAQRDLRMRVYDGNTGEVSLGFMAVRSLSGGSTELYEITESFTMRMGTVRIYLMNYARNIREVFTGDPRAFSGKRILLGIQDESDLDCVTSPDGRYTYFTAVRDLWCYDSQAHTVRNIFSMRSGYTDSIKESYAKHDIRMLECGDGSLSFLLYGYMNRGAHEGETGVAFMQYSAETGTAEEKFFIPAADNFENLDLQMKELSFLGDNSMFYLKLGANVYAVDTKSDDYILIASGLNEGNYCISKGMQKLAWQDDGGEAGSATLHVMDLDTGVKQEIRAQEGYLLKAEGFIGRDLAISIRYPGDVWTVNGRTRAYPADAIEILDDDLNIMTRYVREDVFISDIDVHDGRMSMTLLTRTETGEYAVNGEDTIVSSEEAPERPVVGNYSSEDKARVFYVPLDEDIRRVSVKVAADTDITDNAVVIPGLGTGSFGMYDAYGDGRLIGSYDTIVEAVTAAYPLMGVVRHEGRIVYNRAATVTSRIIANVQDQAEEILARRAAGELMDISGLTLKQALYFVSTKRPVLAYTDRGEARLIYAYDKYAVSLYDPSRGRKYQMGIEEASAMFDRGYRDFSCGFTD